MSRVYNIVNPSDRCSIRAESDLVAALTVFYISNGRYACDADGFKSPLFFPFGGTPDLVSQMFSKHFGITVTLDDPEREDSLARLLRRHAGGIADALESFCYGNRADFESALEHITEPTARGQFITEWNDRHRSSFNDIGAVCRGQVKRFRDADGELRNG